MAFDPESAKPADDTSAGGDKFDPNTAEAADTPFGYEFAKKMGISAGTGMLIGGGIGAAVGGPPTAAAGAAMGGISGMTGAFSGEVAKQLGAGEGGQMAAELAGGMVTPGGLMVAPFVLRKTVQGLLKYPLAYVTDAVVKALGKSPSSISSTQRKIIGEEVQKMRAGSVAEDAMDSRAIFPGLNQELDGIVNGASPKDLALLARRVQGDQGMRKHVLDTLQRSLADKVDKNPAGAVQYFNNIRPTLIETGIASDAEADALLLQLKAIEKMNVPVAQKSFLRNTLIGGLSGLTGPQTAQIARGAPMFRQ